MAIALNKRKNIFTDNPFFKEVSKTVKNIANETGKVVNNVVKEGKKVAENAIRKADRIRKKDKKMTNNRSNETKKTVVSIAKQTKKAITATSKKSIKDIFEGQIDIIKNHIAKNVKNMCEVSNNMGRKKVKFDEEKVDKDLKKELSGMRPLTGKELSDTVDMIVSENEVYNKDLWDKPIDKKDKKRNEFKTRNNETITRLRRYKDKETGLDALLIRRGNGDIELLFQGSKPAAHYPITATINTLTGNNDEETKILSKSNNESYKKDWGNNTVGNMTREQLILAKTIALTHGPNAYNKFLELEKEFSSREKGTPKQLIKALEIANQVKTEYGEKFKRVSGHSLGGAEAIYVASHLNLEAIAVDPAPVNNPGKDLYNKKILVIIPNNGEGMLNKIVPNKNGGKTFQFAPLNECTPDSIDKIGNLISGNKTSGKLPAISVEKGKNTHEVDDKDMEKVATQLSKKMGWSR